MEIMTETQYQIIDKIFSEFDFEIPVSETTGWRQDEPNKYYRTVFFDNKHGPSTWGTFSVTFKPNSTEVLEYGL